MSISFGALLSSNGVLRQPKDRFLRPKSTFVSDCPLCGVIKKAMAVHLGQVGRGKKAHGRTPWSVYTNGIRRMNALGSDPFRIGLVPVHSDSPSGDKDAVLYQISELSVWSVPDTLLDRIEPRESRTEDEHRWTPNSRRVEAYSELSSYPMHIGGRKHAAWPTPRLWDANPSEVYRHPMLERWPQGSTTRSSEAGSAGNHIDDSPLSGTKLSPTALQTPSKPPNSLERRRTEREDLTRNAAIATFITKTSWGEFKYRRPRTVYVLTSDAKPTLCQIWSVISPSFHA